MQRYFVSDQSLQDDVVFISGDDARHIAKVMRMKEGAEIVCCFQDGRSALCALVETSSEMVKADIVKWLDESNELPVKVTIASGLPKGDKLEYIVQKGTELGASEFIPFVAGRSIVKWDEKKGKKKVERLEKIAKEAAEQSYRNVLPSISSPISFKQLIEKSKEYDVCIVAYEEEGKESRHTGLKESFSSLEPSGKLLAVFGPEGGLSEEEVEKLTEAGFIRCSLGPRILRTETAPLYLLSTVSYQFEL